MSFLYGVFTALVVVVGALIALGVYFQKKRTAGATTTPAPKRSALLTNPLVRNLGIVVLVILVVWGVGSLINNEIENPLPYTLALALGALQYFVGSKKGDIKRAMGVTILGVVLIWFLLHPQAVGIVQAIVGPFGESDVLSTWSGSDVSLALNVIMVGIVVWSLWVTGDFFGMLLILGVMFLMRMAICL